VRLPKGSTLVVDRGYTDYAWYNQLNANDIFFVTRQRRNAVYQVVECQATSCPQGQGADQRQGQVCPILLRRIGYRDAETGKHYVFLTNNFKLAAVTITAIYKARWQIELFFEWIKQNLKIESFLGTSKNAVMTQLWIAVCIYLLLAYLKFISRIGRSLQQMLRLLQLNLFERRDLLVLLRGYPPEPKLPTFRLPYSFRESL